MFLEKIYEDLVLNVSKKTLSSSYLVGKKDKIAADKVAC